VRVLMAMTFRVSIVFADLSPLSASKPAGSSSAPAPSGSLSVVRSCAARPNWVIDPCLALCSACEQGTRDRHGRLVAVAEPFAILPDRNRTHAVVSGSVSRHGPRSLSGPESFRLFGSGLLLGRISVPACRRQQRHQRGLQPLRQPHLSAAVRAPTPDEGSTTATATLHFPSSLSVVTLLLLKLGCAQSVLVLRPFAFLFACRFAFGACCCLCDWAGPPWP
jgi:hypothetical protein